MPSSPPPSDSSKNFSTLIALAGLLFLTGGAIAMVSMVLPQVLWMVLVFVGFVLMIAFHYFTWGRWLSQNQPEDEDDL